MSFRRHKQRGARFQENFLSISMRGTVPENRNRWPGREDQGERVIAPQGTRQRSGRTFGISPAVSALADRPQRMFLHRLFIKNTAPCELVRGCIGGDA